MEKKIKETTIYYDGTQSSEEEIKRISRYNLLKNIASKHTVVYSINDTTKTYGIYIFYSEMSATFSSLYWKRKTTHSFTFKKGKLYGSLDGIDTHSIFTLLIEAKKEWVVPYKDTVTILIRRFPKILYRILIGTISNYRQLMNAYKKLLKIKNTIEYSKLEKLLHYPSAFSYYLIDYADNITGAITCLEKDNYYSGGLLWDTLHAAKLLGEKIPYRNFSSNESLQRFHEKQIKKMLFMDKDEKDDTHIYKRASIKGFDVLDSEQSVYINAQIFSNCTFSCYWDRIKSKKYLLLSNGKYNIGFYIKGINFYFDQAHGKYNYDVEKEDHQKINELINSIQKNYTIHDIL